jgi:lantibiotic biosynthesis protein
MSRGSVVPSPAVPREPQPPGQRPDELRSSFRHAGFFVLRSALLPFAELESFDAAGAGEGTSGYTERRAARVSAILRRFEAGELREALFFASTALLQKLEALPARPLALEQTLARYLSRSCSRATPFGVFAGVSLGRVCEATRLELGARSGYRRHTRPSMAFLGALLARVGSRAEPADGVRYQPSSSLHRAWGRVRFSRRGADGKSHPVVDAEPSARLDAALARAATGATLAEIAEALEPTGLPPQRALGYAKSLVAHALLVPSWEPALTAEDPCHAVLQALDGAPRFRPLVAQLRAAIAMLARLDTEPLGSNVDGLREAAETIGQCGAALGLERSNVLHADLVKPAASLSLAPALTERFLAAAELLRRIGARQHDPTLDQFCQRFVARHDTQWIPLVEALDGDLGIGFGEFQRTPTDALVHGIAPLGAARPAPEDAALLAVRLELLSRALRSGATEVTLDEALLARCPAAPPEPAPESFMVVAQLGTRQGRFELVEPALLAPSGIGALARFCHADPELRGALRAHAADEQAHAGSRLLADVVYLPDGEAANVMLRPSLREAEIVYAGRSGADASHQIHVSDLLVSVAQGSVRLYSRRLKRRVSIRISNFFDHSAWQNLPIYRFLAHVENADGRALPAVWSWGALESSSFLPRVVRGDVVLCRARWRLGPAELEPLRRLPPASAFDRVRALRHELHLPRWVVISSIEPNLLIDLDCSLAVEGLVREARNSTAIVLHEQRPAPDELAASGPEGRFVSDVLVPFVRRAVVSTASDDDAPVAHTASLGCAARSYMPGSEWLYAKIYAGTSLLDALVPRLARELVPELPEGTIALWFFVPYADPEAHLRLRFRGDARLLLTHVMPALERLLAAHRASGAIYRLQIDTYERELERYGGPEGIELAEQVFHADSEASARVLESCADDAILRWRLTLLGMDRLLAEFIPELERRAQTVAILLAECRRELSPSAPARKAFAERYRQQAALLRELLWPAETSPTSAPEVARARQLYAERSERLQSVARRLLSALDQGRLGVGRLELVHSLVHMHVVRMLGIRAHAHELVLYDFLRRLYVSRLARPATRQLSGMEAS